MGPANCCLPLDHRSSGSDEPHTYHATARFAPPLYHPERHRQHLPFAFKPASDLLVLYIVEHNPRWRHCPIEFIFEGFKGSGLLQDGMFCHIMERPILLVIVGVLLTSLPVLRRRDGAG